jgi:hypothetical protein
VDGIIHVGWSGKRHAFPLGDGFCVTDYFAEGLSFGSYPWLTHLGKPDHGHLERASVLVTLTRHRDWDAVLPWSPLWKNGDVEARAEVIKAFERVARPSADLAADLRRLARAEDSTLSQFRTEWMRLLDRFEA